jgi:hypothetical protein
MAAPSTDQAHLERDARIYEYTSAANPTMTEVPHLALPSAHHEQGESSCREGVMRRRRGIGSHNKRERATCWGGRAGVLRGSVIGVF